MLLVKLLIGMVQLLFLLLDLELIGVELGCVLRALLSVGRSLGFQFLSLALLFLELLLLSMLLLLLLLSLVTDPVAPGQLAYATSYGEIFELKSRAGKDDSVVFRGAAAIKSNSLGVVGADYTEAF